MVGRLANGPEHPYRVPNDQFRGLRLAGGFTQAQLAEFVCADLERATGRSGAVDAQAISRIERGEITWPSSETRRSLRNVLGVGSDRDLGLAPKRTRSDVEKVKAANRRDFMALAGVGLIEATSRRIGALDVEHMRNRFARLRDLDNYAGGADTFRIYGSELVRTETLLTRGHYSANTRNALVSLAAEQAQQLGWAAFDAGQTRQAIRVFEYSHRAATEGNCPDLAANALIHISYAAGGREATAAAESACRAISSSAHPRTQALLESRRAWSLAVVGDRDEAARALDRARDALSRADDAPAPDWTAWVDATELDIMAGRVWVVLHDHRRSIPALERALALYPAHWARDRALYMMFLADAYIDRGEVERAATITIDALTLTRGIASVRPMTRAREVARRLPVKVPEVHRLAELLASFHPPTSTAR
jgi:transcriptional regulator with XRE-family HTH domain